jgi:hypothetical protein
MLGIISDHAWKTERTQKYVLEYTIELISREQINADQ